MRIAISILATVIHTKFARTFVQFFTAISGQCTGQTSSYSKF